METERLSLREIRIDDAAFVLELLNEPGFIENIGDRGVRTLDDAVRYIRNGPLTSYARLGFGHYLVELKESGTPIGMCGLRSRDGLPDPDLGYAYLHSHWGRGYASEAAHAVLAFARNVLRLPRVLAICSPTNTASEAVLKKVGFQFEKQIRLSGDDHDVQLFALEIAIQPAAPM